MIMKKKSQTSIQMKMTNMKKCSCHTKESIIPELYFCNPDPFLKPEPLPDDHYRPEIHFDDEGRIVVKNLDAYWLPEMKLVEEIDGTIYTVTGSYEGTEMLDQKLSRIMLNNLENF